MDNFMTRMKEFLDNQGITLASFEKSVGISNGLFGKCIKNGGYLGGEKIENVLSHYTELSAEWLFRGNGSMFLSNTEQRDKQGVIRMYSDLLAERDQKIRDLEAQIIDLESIRKHA